MTDMFCGAGGSTSGAIQVPGVRVLMAANHWQLDTHNHNHPDTDHDRADLHAVDPPRYPQTDLLWASPECTNHSKAKGKKRGQPALFGRNGKNEEPDPGAERSRATMWDVPRFAEYHRYRGIIVENVVDVRERWELWPAWLHAMDCLDYDVRVVYLNSMFANRLGPAAPQSRNRMYVVAWRRGERAPDLNRWTRPVATCDQCGHSGLAVQGWKRLDRQFGVYGRNGQYWWRCPTKRCHAIVQPPVLPASAALDFTVLGERIGDRKDPLEPPTIRRIERFFEKYGTAPMLAPAGGTWREHAAPVDQPMPTRTATESDGIAVPPMLLPVEGREGVWARPVTEPARTQTSRAETALVVPLRNNGVARPADQHPLMTIAAGGEHQMLVEYYGNGRAVPVTQPIPTIPTKDRFALVSSTVPRVEDCTFRMLEISEIQAGMAFAPTYTILGTAKRDRVRQLGNAVTPPAARDLIAAMTEAITGVEIAA